MLPNDYPDWELVYYYLGKWAQDGTVEKIHHGLVIRTRMALGREPSPSLVLVDSQSVKSMSVTDCKRFDGNKKRQGRKRFVLTHTLDHPHAGLYLGLGGHGGQRRRGQRGRTGHSQTGVGKVDRPLGSLTQNTG